MLIIYINIYIVTLPSLDKICWSQRRDEVILTSEYHEKGNVQSQKKCLSLYYSVPITFLTGLKFVRSEVVF